VSADADQTDARFLARWWIVVLSSAALVSSIDAILLQRRKSFFTGGFLAVDHLQGPMETAAFLLVAWLADLAVAGLLAALVLWALAWLRLRATACTLAGALAAVVPLIAADIIAYRLVSYLGDAFDLALLFDLTGRRVSEIVAVASSHLVAPAVVMTGVALSGVTFVWIVNRYSSGEPVNRPRLRALRVPVILCAAGVLTTTAAATSSDVIENGLLRKPAGQALAFIANIVTDVDRDGYGLVGRLTDPDPFSASIFPYAVDVPGNGIDEDGVGGDLPGTTSDYRERSIPSSPPTHRPDVVLVVLESFRADLVGSRHNGRPVTPAIDAIAERGITSHEAYSHNGYTGQSRYHLFTGSLTPRPDRKTLVDDFRDNGYLVGYFSGQDESFGGPDLAVGFERAHVAYDARADYSRRYSTASTAGSLAVPFTVVQERVNAFLGQHGAQARPLFVYVNFHDTHFPYWHEGIDTIASPARLSRSAIAPRRRDELLATYINTAANVDRAVGGVVAAVRRTRVTEPAIIITADHGESLFDEGFLGHGYGLNDAQTRIPLIAANLPIAIDEPFGQADLRHVLAAALREPREASKPRLTRPVESKRVFQYLGHIDRPRQIGFVHERTRTIYDFRSQRAQLRGGPWRRADDLAGADRAELMELVHYWERIRFAHPSTGAK
jgi:hypothetical protein